MKEDKLREKLPEIAAAPPPVGAATETSGHKPGGTKQITSPAPAAAGTEQLEFSSPVKAAPQEQRQRRRRVKDEVDDTGVETHKPELPSQPLDQRVRRKDRKPEPAGETETEKKKPSGPVPVASVPPPRTAEETDDLEFLESLDKPAPAAEPNLPAPGVVPVKIVKEEEKKDLEDWLDDFLGD